MYPSQLYNLPQKGTIMTNEHNKTEYNKAFQEADTEIAGHYLYQEIQDLKKKNGSEDSKVSMRWIWELLQNAHDARSGNTVTVAVEYSQETKELIFLHDGRSFKPDEIVRLIKAGTTKDKVDEGTHGEFGRGFLTTHLLSPKVEVHGRLEDDQWFNFTLDRNDESREVLSKSLKQAQKGFMHSFSTDKPVLIPAQFTTRFMFSIVGDNSKEAVKSGIKMLRKCTPYIAIFNKEFSCINIKTLNKTRYFKVFGDPTSVASEIQQITVIENTDENVSEKQYLLAQSEQETSVAVPIQLKDGNLMCASIEKDTPRLFWALPLVDTDSFSFPAVVNNPHFSSGSDRDNVTLDGHEASNSKNREFIEEACTLLIGLIQFASSKRWVHVHQWAKIPFVKHLRIQKRPELKKCLKKFIEQISLTHAVVTQFDDVIAPKDACFPLAENDESVKKLWSLLNDLREYREKLPRPDEAIGWRKAINSWAKVNECEVSNLPDVGVIHGRMLASYIEKCCDLETLQSSLQEGVCAVKWLDRFYEFLKDVELFNDVIHKFRFIPNQRGEFHYLTELHSDKDIDEELKEIGDFFDIEPSIKQSLRHTLLKSLETEVGAGPWDDKSVLDTLIDELKWEAEYNLDDNFRMASTRLFAWIVRKEEYSRLRGFPTFAEAANSDNPSIIYLSEDECPLAPVQSWPNDLQTYADLFPSRHILAHAFFEAVGEENVWPMLETEGFVRMDVIIRDHREVSSDMFKLRGPLEGEHESEKKIAVTDIAFLRTKDIGIIDRVRKSRDLACKFWRFLTEWLIVHDSKGVEIINDVLCSCEETHQCYPAAWLVPLVTRQWIPSERDKSVLAKPETLANLILSSGSDLYTLSENARKLLVAIGVSPFELIRETFIESENHDAVDDAFIEMMRMSKGNISHFTHAIEYMKAVSNNENLQQNFETLLDATDGDLSKVTEIAQNLQEDEESKQVVDTRLKERRNIKQNRCLGLTVEEIVGNYLGKLNKSFKVKEEELEVDPIHKGADYVITLKINQDKQRWWIEVKSTRTDRVKMSSDQAQNAKKKGEKFLLCVVPLEPGDVNPDPETVRQNMRFIANINDRVAPLCEKIDRLEGIQTDITTDAPSGVELVIEGSKASVLVKESVWQSNEAFPLEELAENLQKTKNTN